MKQNNAFGNIPIAHYRLKYVFEVMIKSITILFLINIFIISAATIANISNLHKMDIMRFCHDSLYLVSTEDVDVLCGILSKSGMTFLLSFLSDIV